MDLQLDGRTVLVTGGNRGIGKATALAYAAERANVAITYHSDEAAARAVVQELEAAGGGGFATPLDLANTQSTSDAVQRTVEHFGGLDALVVSSVYRPGAENVPLAEADWDVWRTSVHTNVDGTVELIRAALPHLGASSAGRIVLFSAGVAREGRAGASAYAVAKTALEGLTGALKWEAGAHGILVNIVSPGFTLTDKNFEVFPEDLRNMILRRTPSGHLSTPEDVARTAVFLGSPANGNVSGVYVPVSGGIG